MAFRQLPLRLAAGSYMLHSGLSKWNADETTAKQLQAFAASAYPFLAKLDPRLFVNALSASEIIVGAAVLVPFVPSAIASAARTTVNIAAAPYRSSTGISTNGSAALDSRDSEYVQPTAVARTSLGKISAW